MRFGRDFRKHQLPHWIPQYVNYDAAKILLKTANRQHRDHDGGRENHDFAVFIDIFTEELEKVEQFYLTRYGIFYRTALQQPQGARSQYSLKSTHAIDVQHTDRRQLEEDLGNLLELLDNLTKLCWFGYVNFTAFQRLKNKFERLAPFHYSLTNIESRLNEQNFAHQSECLEAVQKVGNLVDRLSIVLEHNVATEPSPFEVTSLPRSLAHSCKGTPYDLPSLLARRQRVEEFLYNKCQPIDYSAIFAKLDRSPLGDLHTTDRLGRIPLHYAAKSGRLELCRHYLKSTIEDRKNASNFNEPLLIADIDGNTPLHLSILAGHVNVVNYLLGVIRSQDEAPNRLQNQLPNVLGSLLQLAAWCNLTDIAQVLIDNGASISYRSLHGETTLHIASRKGNAEIVQAVRNVVCFEEIIDLQEPIHGHTALMISCVEGTESIVELLVGAGANPDISDARGWTAKEHAVFQGQLRLLKYIKAATRSEAARPMFKNDGIHQAVYKALPRFIRPQKSFDRTKVQVFVNLGVSNTRNSVKMVDLKLPSWYKGNDTLYQAGFALEISLGSGSEPKNLVPLPVLEDLTNRPIFFDVEDPHEAKIVFNLCRMQDYRERRTELVGSGVAILSSLKDRLASKHESLVRDHTIPILSTDTLEIMGCITFSFLIVSPFAHSAAPSIATHGFWKDHGSTGVVGHRGSGANTTLKTNLQIGENTIQSFMSAVASGASCVEFDVQLTKDLIPVIFHDFLVMETGGDVPLHTLTRDQFMQLSRLQSSRERSPIHNGSTHQHFGEAIQKKKARSRSQSDIRYDDDGAGKLRQRMQYTEEGLRNEIKGNLRGFSIQEPSTTLEELFTNLPESISFNLEMKYPMLWEAEDRDMDFFAMELNLFVDTILKMVYRLGGRRSITFSSFSPETCIMLSLKQQDYPVLFINKAGSVPTGDIRASNLQQAIQFAKAWQLAGIVMLSDVFVSCPQLLRYAKSSGLVCGSYGNLNDDPVCAKVWSPVLSPWVV
ncbi:MAG: hypothetical protein Q9225_002755 [Loekoesia sp. 1 TL-2023]